MAQPADANPAPASAELQPPDTELVRRAQQDDLAAYDELVRRHHSRIYGTIYHMTSNHEDASDLAQDTFVQGFKSLKNFKGESSYFTWIYRVAVNLTLNFLKRRSNRKPHFSLNDIETNPELELELNEFVSDQTPRRAVALTELHEKLNAALQQLSENHRLVVTLHDIQGLPHDEIAKITGCNVATVRSRLFYARQMLQGLLSDYLK
jgi:RNA polymerase sigma-70 factor (ECF subfamily)